MRPWEELRYVVKHYLIGDYDTNTFSDIYYEIYVHKMYHYQFTEAEKVALDKLLTVSSRYSPYLEDRKTGIYFTEEEVRKQAKVVNELISKSEK